MSHHDVRVPFLSIYIYGRETPLLLITHTDADFNNIQKMKKCVPRLLGKMKITSGALKRSHSQKNLV